MTTTLYHQPTNRTFTLERNPNLGNFHRRSMEQDNDRSDSGKDVIFTRKVPRLEMRLNFRGLSHQQQSDFEQFYFMVLKESQEVFDITFPPVVALAWQPGMTLNGSLLQVGQTIKCSTADPGFILEAGRFLRLMDTITLTNVRITKSSFGNTDNLKKATDVSINISQELPTN